MIINLIHKSIRIATLILTCFVALTAIAGGIAILLAFLLRYVRMANAGYFTMAAGLNNILLNGMIYSESLWIVRNSV
ncbi:MAG: hypothetical protein E4H13_08195 [Calditrichales bacterium]|nr:MAG: hypothetical protein E4H13_08195 [Calditrichales bacterium]